MTSERDGHIVPVSPGPRSAIVVCSSGGMAKVPGNISREDRRACVQLARPLVCASEALRAAHRSKSVSAGDVSGDQYIAPGLLKQA